MNHPPSETWMSYLYGELSAGERAKLSAHLQTCPDCAAKIGDWQSAQNQLDAWRVPAKRRRAALALPALKWAAAAAILLSAGFSAGRFTAATVEAEKVRAALEPELRREFAQTLRAELDKSASATLAASAAQTKALLADYAGAAEAARAADHQAYDAALNKVTLQHDADFVLLKKDLDTVAVNTDADLRRTEQQVIQLADSTQPGGSTDSTPK